MEQLFEFAGNHVLLVSAAFFLTVLVIVNEIRHAGKAGQTVSPDEVVRLMNGGALVLDLRGREEYEAGHIANARNVPLAELEAEAEKLSKYKARPVITYDDRGMTAGRAVATLRKLAFEKAFSLRGGLMAWRQEQLPLEKPAPKGGSKGKKAKAEQADNDADAG